MTGPNPALIRTQLDRAGRALAADTLPRTSRQRDMLDLAAADIAKALAGDRLACALGRLVDHLPGYPAGGTGPSGKGGVSDPTSRLATQPRDPVAVALDTLTTTAARLDRHTIRLLYPFATQADATKTIRSVVADARTVQELVSWWARPPQVRWCEHCAEVNGHKEPVALSRYRAVCRHCGDWRAVNGSLPPPEILRYLQAREPIPENLLRRYRAKLPNSSKLRRRKKSRAST